MALQHTAGGSLLMTSGGALADECCCGGPPPDECAWYLSPDALSFDCNAQSGSFNINVPTGTNCGWEASVTSGGAYLAITAGSTGNTDGTVDFDILGNPDPQRTATITVVTTVVSPLGPIGTVIGTFTMTQDECATISPALPPGCCPGQPPGPGQTCTWSIGPTNFLLSCFPQSSFFNVNTQLGCGWAATVISGGAYITITSGATGSDAGSVFFSITANPGVARGGQIEVRTTVVSTLGPIGSLIGIVNISQLVCPGGGGGAPCSWKATGGWYVGNPCAVETGNFEVITYAGCGWEATAMDPWITITSGSTGLSTGTIVFDIAANTTGSFRTGTIEVTSTTASVLGPVGTLLGIVTVYQDTCAPAACPGGLNLTYSIDGYFDGFIPMSDCPACMEPGGALPIWDGVFTRMFLIPACNWNHTGALLFQIQIDGQVITNDPNDLKLFLVPNVAWRIQIRCANFGTPQMVWLGEKVFGSTPEGVYIKTSGCAGPSTITII